MELTNNALEAKRAYQKQWREKNKERLKEYCKEYRQAHPEAIKEYNRKYWERKANEFI